MKLCPDCGARGGRNKNCPTCQRFHDGLKEAPKRNSPFQQKPSRNAPLQKKAPKSNAALQTKPSGNDSLPKASPARNEPLQEVFPVADAPTEHWVACACGCGEKVKARPVYFSDACRLRAWRARR